MEEAWHISRLNVKPTGEILQWNVCYTQRKKLSFTDISKRTMQGWSSQVCFDMIQMRKQGNFKLMGIIPKDLSTHSSIYITHSFFRESQSLAQTINIHLNLSWAASPFLLEYLSIMDWNHHHHLLFSSTVLLPKSLSIGQALSRSQDTVLWHGSLPFLRHDRVW